MAMLPPYPGSDENRKSGGEPESVRARRWTTAAVIGVAVILVLVLAGMHLMGAIGSGGH